MGRRGRRAIKATVLVSELVTGLAFCAALFCRASSSTQAAGVASTIHLLAPCAPGNIVARGFTTCTQVSLRSPAAIGGRRLVPLGVPAPLRPLGGGLPLALSARTAASTESVEMPVFRGERFGGLARNLLVVGMLGGIIAGSWALTGRWWMLPTLIAMPVVLHRVWMSRLDARRFGELSAAVDPRLIASTAEMQRKLHSLMCSCCGYTLFPAMGREAFFFVDGFKCPMCGAPRNDFVDVSGKGSEVASGGERTTGIAGVASVDGGKTIG